MVAEAVAGRSEQASATLTEAGTVAQKFDNDIHAMQRPIGVQGMEESVYHSDDKLPTSNFQNQEAQVDSEVIEGQRFRTMVEAVDRIGGSSDETGQCAESEKTRYVVVSAQQRSKTGGDHLWKGQPVSIFERTLPGRYSTDLLLRGETNVRTSHQ